MEHHSGLMKLEMMKDGGFRNPPDKLIGFQIEALFLVNNAL